MREQIPYGQIGTLDVRLANWLPPNERYQASYSPVEPRLQFLANDPESLASRFNQAYWKVDDWSGGEGFRTWEPGGNTYRQSDTVRPARDGLGGVTLGHPVENTQVTGPSDLTLDLPGILDDWQGTIGVIMPGSSGVGDATHRVWNQQSELWGSSFDLGDYFIWDGAPGGDGINYYVSNNDGDFRKHEGGGSSAANTSVNTAFSYGMAHYRGFIYYLDSGEGGANPGLWRITPGGASTAAPTQVWDPGSRVDDIDGFPYSSQAAYGNWVTPTDVGVAFIVPLSTGEVGVFQYNAESDVTSQIGRLPGKQPMFYDIIFERGVVFVGFHSQYEYNTSDPIYGGAGKAYVWYVVTRSGQSGVLGPLRNLNGSEVTSSVRVAGADGDDLIIVYDRAAWAYNLTDGGITHLGNFRSRWGRVQRKRKGEPVFRVLRRVGTIQLKLCGAHVARAIRVYWHDRLRLLRHAVLRHSEDDPGTDGCDRPVAGRHEHRGVLQGGRYGQLHVAGHKRHR